MFRNSLMKPVFDESLKLKHNQLKPFIEQIEHYGFSDEMVRGIELR